MSDPIPHPKMYEYITRHPGSVLKSGNGGGTSDGMETRISKLEVQMEHVLQDTATLKTDVSAIKDQVSSLKEQVSELKGRVSMLPGYGGIALIVGLIVGLSTLAQIASRFIPPAG